MVTYIRSDLDFILDQIQIAEAHAAGQPLYGPGGLVPAYNVSWGLRTVDGSYNNLLYPTLGAADHPFPSLMDPEYRPATPASVDFDGPGPAPPITTASNYNPTNDPNSIVMDPALRTISNLIVDQTLDNTAAIMVALSRAGVETATEQLTIAGQIKAEYQTVKPFLEAAEDASLANVSAQRTLVAAQQAFNNDPTTENQAALDAATAAANLAPIPKGRSISPIRIASPSSMLHVGAVQASPLRHNPARWLHREGRSRDASSGFHNTCVRDFCDTQRLNWEG